MMKFVVLVVVGICVSCVSAISFKGCEVDGKKPFFKPSKVDLEPSKPQRGHDAIFTIYGNNGIQLETHFSQFLNFRTYGSKWRFHN